MISLLDLDIVGYRSAASCEPNKVKLEREPLEFAIARCDDLMRRILHETNAHSYRGFISGPDNFRYSIDPTYKANRVDTERPAWLQPVREHLVVNWNAIVSDGIEADDNLGISQCMEYDETCIASIDKDLLQIPGHHYNFVTGVWTHITPLDGWKHFYIQLIMGDKSDNIQGYDGKMRPKVPKFLQGYVDAINAAGSPREMFDVVADIYELGEEAMIRNAKLLYIWRQPDDYWGVPTLGYEE